MTDTTKHGLDQAVSDLRAVLDTIDMMAQNDAPLRLRVGPALGHLQAAIDLLDTARASGD